MNLVQQKDTRHLFILFFLECVYLYEVVESFIKKPTRFPEVGFSCSVNFKISANQ